jgi:hypothetical protein
MTGASGDGDLAQDAAEPRSALSDCALAEDATQSGPQVRDSFRVQESLVSFSLHPPPPLCPPPLRRRPAVPCMPQKTLKGGFAPLALARTRSWPLGTLSESQPELSCVIDGSNAPAVMDCWLGHGDVVLRP